MACKIVQCGYMSGDTFAAAALLAVDPGVEIILVKDTKATGQYADKTKHILKIYTESGVVGRVKLLDISGSKVTIEDLWKSVSKAYKDGYSLPDMRSADALVNYQLQLCHSFEPKRAWPRSITAVTGLLANIWESNPEAARAAVARAWKVGKLPPEQQRALFDYMNQVFAKTNVNMRKNIVVLWSRKSGKRGGAHLELDSSYKGIRQLAWNFAEVDKRSTVLLAGDESNFKMEQYARNELQIVNVTNMWDAPVWKDVFGDATFLAQFAFYKYLAIDYNVVHVGMRSGMLEAMALLGMQTFYLEGHGSGSGERMLAFSHAGITYTRVQIEDAPSLTGRISESQKLFTKESVDQAVARLAKANKERSGFQRNFAGHNVKDTDTDWAAKNYAKAKLLGKALDDQSYNRGRHWDNMAGDMRAKRGFTNDSVDRIVKLVTGTFT